MSSGSWYRMSREESEKVRKYKKHKGELEPIVSAIGSSFGSVIGDINKFVKNTESEMNDGVRKDSAVTSNISQLENGDEHSTSSDGKMSSCNSSLKTEIKELQGKIEEAERKADEYRERGDREKEEERRRIAQRIKESLGR